jgi:hypothetical protein
LILITLVLRPALLFGNSPLFSLTLLIKAAILLRLILSQLFSSSLLIGLTSLQFEVLALLILRLSLLILTLLLLTLARSLTLLLVRLSPLLVLRLSLLVLRLSLVVPALRLSLPALVSLPVLVVILTAAAPATFVLRLSGLAVPLLLFCLLLRSLSLPVLTALRLLSIREAAHSWQKYCSYGRGKSHAIDVITSHNLSPSKDRAEGKVISLP